MSYLILARKYRPQGFSDLTGQETTAKILKSAISQNRIAPSYLFSGPRGTGKTTSARIFAKALNCHNKKDTESCNECSSCQEISRSSSIDVLEMDAASHTQVDNIREVVINTVSYAPVRDQYKIFIIDEVHMLSNHSFNALLKTLEEPPPHVVFILATTEFHKIPATISSRCQRFRFLPLTHKDILMNLQKVSQTEKISISDDALSLLAHSSAGSMRDALSLLDQTISHLPTGPKLKNSSSIDHGQVEKILGIVREDSIVEFIEKVSQRDPKGVLELIHNLLKEGHDLSYFLKELRGTFREMLVQKCGFDEGDSLAHRKKKLPVEKFSVEELLRDAQLLSKCAEQMRWNDFPRMVFECYAVRLCSETIETQEWIDRLEKIESSLERGEPSPPVPNRPQTGSTAREMNRSQMAPAPSQPEQKLPPPVKPGPQIKISSDPSSHSQNRPQQTGTQVLEKNETDFRQIWKNVLDGIQQSKPSLFPVLEKVHPQYNNQTVDLAIANAFSLDTAKRNLTLLENSFSTHCGRKITVNLKLSDKPAAAAHNHSGSDIVDSEVEHSTAESKENDDTVVIEQPSAIREFYDNQEVFEPVDLSLSAIEDAVEDEGTKKFLSVFHGKVTRNSSPSR